MRGFRFRSILYSEWCAHICLAFLKTQMFGGQTFIFEPTLNLFSRYVSTHRRRYHSSQVCVDVAGRDSCRFNGLYTDVAKISISNFRWVGTAFSGRTPTSQDRFVLWQVLWPDFSTSKSFDSSTKVIPSLQVISLSVRDRPWNELPAKFKITWRHSNRPIRWRS